MNNKRSLEMRGLRKLFYKIVSIKYLKEFLVFIFIFYVTLVVVFSLIYYIIAIKSISNDNSFFVWLYFSLVTLTTVGYGDITPVNDVMRFMTSIEAFIGYISPSIIVSIGLALIFKENKI